MPAWLKAAFLFFLVGYGTKMGLAPMHTWLPDAHSESPSLVSALLSGALLNCAFLGILRAHQVCVAAGLADFSQELLRDLRPAVDGRRGGLHPRPDRLQADARLFERRAHGHPGAGRRAGRGRRLRRGAARGQSLADQGDACSSWRATSWRAIGTKSVRDIRGVRRGCCRCRGCSGSPASWRSPARRRSARSSASSRSSRPRSTRGQGFVAVAYLALLALIFVGMAMIVLPMVQGEPAEPAEGRRREAAWATLAAAALLIAGPGAGDLRAAATQRRAVPSGPRPRRLARRSGPSHARR